MVNLKETLLNFLTVKTVKLVQIRHWKLALFNYLVILTILLYVIVAQIVLKKGYQATDTLVGDVNIKMKGTAWSEVNGGFVNWDEYDVVTPAKEEDAFFVTTSYQITPKQVRGECTTPNSALSCSVTNNTCKYGQVSSKWSGIQTGNCITPPGADNGYCGLYSWCPIEEDATPNRLYNVEQFTAFTKAYARSNRFGVSMTNVKNSSDNQLNLFSIGQTLSDCKPGHPNADNTLTCANMLNYFNNDSRGEWNSGALIIGIYNWDCDLDRNVNDCSPSVAFHRIDSPLSSFSKGYNFRYTKTYGNYNGTDWTDYRDLYKVYGLRYVFLAGGRGGKFDFVALGTSLGSGLALLGVATLLTDLLVVYIVPQRENYKEHKFESVAEREHQKHDLPGNESTSLLPH